MWSPMRRDAIRNARVAPNTVECALCRRRMKENPRDGAPKEYQVDHKVPASEPAAAIHSWDDYFQRLFVPAEGHWILCIPCHDQKTREENSKRVVKKKRTIRRKAK
jgi:5-methylcytosine-specific restriction endonuclease McrA